MTHQFTIGDTVKIRQSGVEAEITKIVPSPRGGPRVLYQCQWTQDGKTVTTYFNDHAIELVRAVETPA